MNTYKEQENKSKEKNLRIIPVEFLQHANTSLC